MHEVVHARDGKKGECRHQFRVLGEFKRGVDVAHEDWLCVREGTPLLGECPLHPYVDYTIGLGRFPKKNVFTPPTYNPSSSKISTDSVSHHSLHLPI
uniref:Uncharacterized protein n=1 Tax=Helianthus annuus TaxID=4232 RepID=A0A251RSM7_HELAN